MGYEIAEHAINLLGHLTQNTSSARLCRGYSRISDRSSDVIAGQPGHDD
jgi:hypothetical protein